MKKYQRTALVVGSFVGGLVCLAVYLTACGKAIPLDVEGFLGDAVVGDDGTRTDGSDLGAIYPVTTVVAATAGPSIAGFSVGDGDCPPPAWDYPFTGPRLGFNDATLNAQVPFNFTFTYPPNNYQLSAAHLVLDTARDSSDTEGIFVDGVFSGAPAGACLTSAKVTDNITNPTNNYYMQYSATHYTITDRQTIDLDVSNLLTPSAKTIQGLLSDGALPVVTGDDSPIYQGYLVMDGFTISKTALTCTTAGPYTYTNRYVHNDGNSISQAAFSGTVETPFQSVSSVVAGNVFKSIETYFDPSLPRVPIGDISLTTGTLTVNVRRNDLKSAIVVNGVGVSETGFDRNQATVAVEQWDDSTATNAYWTALLATIPTAVAPAVGVATNVTIDLRSMFGESTLKTLLAQGKLNVAFAGGFRQITAGNNSSARAPGTQVSGPNLNLAGTYTNQVCDIPNDPDSPLQGGGVLPPVPGDTTSPQIISAQATSITNNSATVVWMTDEGASTQLAYGVANTDTLTTTNATMKTFHQVNLTGLLPYKYYYFKARSADFWGNLTESGIKVFRTLR